MFTKKEILQIGKKAYSDFSKRHKIDCKIKIVKPNKFWKIANQSEIIRNKMNEGIPVEVGAVVLHSKIDTVYVSDLVINTITEDKNFLRAIFMHEFYHVYFKKLLKNNDLKSSFASEKRAKLKLKKDFPKLGKYFIL
jgi:hypothetical protein